MRLSDSAADGSVDDSRSGRGDAVVENQSGERGVDDEAVGRAGDRIVMDGTLRGAGDGQAADLIVTHQQTGRAIERHGAERILRKRDIGGVGDRDCALHIQIANCQAGCAVDRDTWREGHTIEAGDGDPRVGCAEGQRAVLGGLSDKDEVSGR